MMSMRKKQKSFTVSTLITLFIVAMLVISGPAQAVQVSMNTYNINYREIGETGYFYVNITIGANERIPIANISVEGLPDIPGSPGGLLVFNVSDFDSVGAHINKDNYNISLIDRHGWVDGYGYGYGYNNNIESPPYYGYGYGSQFYGYGYGYGYDYGYGYGYGNGYGYGYGYGNPDTYTRLNYKITVDTTGANPQVYNIVAKVNTGRGVLFQKSESFRLIDNIIDNTPPASVTDLHNITYAQTYINWTWTDPADADFANVSVWIDGIFKDNVPKGIQFYNATGFAPDTEHTIATRTVDTSGNTNGTWVNYTARTAPVPLIHVSIETKDHINPKSKGIIKVTVINNTPEGFDVASINTSSVRFGPGGAVAFENQIKSGNLLLDFNTEDTGIQCGDTQATLIGKTYIGEDIVGSADIKTVGCGGGGRSGGGGGGFGSGEPFDNIDVHEERDGDIRVNYPVTFKFSKAGHRITEIVITGIESQSGVSIRVEALKGKPRQVDVPIPGAIYMNILANTKKIKEARINFMVENTWVASNGITSDKVKLYRWEDSRWAQLKTIMIKKDEFYTYLAADTPGFSSFAIAGPVIDGAKQSGTIPQGLTSTATDTAQATEAPKKAPSVNPAVVIGLVGLIAAAAYVFKRK